MNVDKLRFYVKLYLKVNCPKIREIVIFGCVFKVLFSFLLKENREQCLNKETKKVIAEWILSLNYAFILAMTLLGRTVEKNYGFHLCPLESYVNVFHNSDVVLFLQIVLNIVMFIPIGILLPYRFKKLRKYKYLLGTIALCSGSIEVIQIATKIGFFEVDDILNNLIGATIGMIIYVVITQMKLKNKKMKVD